MNFSRFYLSRYISRSTLICLTLLEAHNLSFSLPSLSPSISFKRIVRTWYITAYKNYEKGLLSQADNFVLTFPNTCVCVCVLILSRPSSDVSVWILFQISFHLLSGSPHRVIHGSFTIWVWRVLRRFRHS